MPGITVGIDGSDQSRRALEWAIKEAAIRNTPLTVLAVHQVAGNHWSGNPEIYPADQPETEKARQAAQDLVQKTIDASGGSGPSVTVRAVSGIAAQELIKARTTATWWSSAPAAAADSRGSGWARRPTRW
jgi:nucleotide-binding universal stress UspA family protein